MNHASALLCLTLRRVLEALTMYPDRTDFKRKYPELEDKDIRQAFTFAAAMVDDKSYPRRRSNGHLQVLL